MEGYETGEESRGEAKEVRHCLLAYIRDGILKLVKESLLMVL